MASTSFLSSTLFKIIGPGKTTFNVHGGLLAQKSKVLDKAVNGTMKESKTKTIEIKAVEGDIDDDTLMRFLEYVYTGDYSVPDPMVLQLASDSKEVIEAFSSKEPPEATASGEDMHAGNPLPREFVPAFRTNFRNKKESRSGKNQWHNAHADESTPVPALTWLKYNDLSRPIHTSPEAALAEPRESGPFTSGKMTITRTTLRKSFCSSAVLPQPKTWLPPVNNDQREDFTPILLCHARLYKFSDRYECPELMFLSLQRLRATLSQYEFHQERASVIVELVRYAYQHTMEFDEGYDKLRSLVLNYATCYIQQLAKEQSFLDLMKEPGPLAADLLGKTVRLFQ